MESAGINACMQVADGVGYMIIYSILFSVRALCWVKQRKEQVSGDEQR